MPRRFDTTILPLLLLLTIPLFGCKGIQHERNIYPDREELLERGFYMYVVPQHIQEKYQWQESTFILSWDRHCKGISYSEQWNPLYIFYSGETTGLTIRLDPWNTIWDNQSLTQTIRVKSPHIQNEQIETYVLPLSEGTSFRFEDNLGFPVYISSNLSLSDTIQIVSQLEYLGPDTSQEPNPWDCSSEK